MFITLVYLCFSIYALVKAAVVFGTFLLIMFVVTTERVPRCSQ